MRRLVNEFALTYLEGDAERACELTTNASRRGIRNALAPGLNIQSVGEEFETCVYFFARLSKLTSGQAAGLPSELADELKQETDEAIAAFRADEGIASVSVGESGATAKSPYFNQAFKLDLFNGSWRIRRTGLPPIHASGTPEVDTTTT